MIIIIHLIIKIIIILVILVIWRCIISGILKYIIITLISHICLCKYIILKRVCICRLHRIRIWKNIIIKIFWSLNQIIIGINRILILKYIINIWTCIYYIIIVIISTLLKNVCCHLSLWAEDLTRYLNLLIIWKNIVNIVTWIWW